MPRSFYRAIPVMVLLTIPTAAIAGLNHWSVPALYGVAFAITLVTLPLWIRDVPPRR